MMAFCIEVLICFSKFNSENHKTNIKSHNVLEKKFVYPQRVNNFAVRFKNNISQLDNYW
jgi:hypothetical protein